MSIAAERDFCLRRGVRREHIRYGSATDERRSLKQKDPQPERVEAEIARRRGATTEHPPKWGCEGEARTSPGYFCFNGDTHSFSAACQGIPKHPWDVPT